MLRLPGPQPLRGALIQLEPGWHAAMTDTTGFFRVSKLQAGRYFLRVRYLGFAPAQDSVTKTDAGLEVAAILVANHPIGIQECSVKRVIH